MKRVTWIGIFLIFLGGRVLLASNDFGQEERNLGQLVPKEIHGWEAEGNDEYFDPETIFDYIDGAGEVYRAYNFQKLLARRYKKEGKPDLVVDFFDMGSSQDAFGVFTHDLEGESPGIGQGSTYKGGLLSLWKDRFFVSLYAEEETEETQQAIFALGKQVAEAVGKEGDKPLLLELLPEGIFSEKNVHYFHNHLILNYHFFVSEENLLMLDQQTEAVLAFLGEKKEKSYLLLVRYSDPVKASRACQNFARIYMPDAVEPGLVQTEDKKWTAAKVKEDIVYVIFNAPSALWAKDMLSKVDKK